MRRRTGVLLQVIFWLSACLLQQQSTMTMAHYSNVTLTSQDGDLSVVVYLPIGIKPTEKTYYIASRFDHGSMIGSIKRRSRGTHHHHHNNNEQHTLFDDKLWRIPHNSQWPESGIGLAAEFGVGDDGAFCQYRCGWDAIDDVTNGLLGYREAKNGEPFLKIGVGLLIKGSCQSCDSTDNYRFNSPYEFAELPHWTLQQPSNEIIILEHQAVLNRDGYKLRKEIVLHDNVLLVTTTLTNIGTKPFATAWYSHNFFSCDSIPINEQYALELGLKGRNGRLFEEPGVIGSWAKPLEEFANVGRYPDSVTVDVFRQLDDDTRIKAEFVRDEGSRGEHTIKACGTSVKTDFPQVKGAGTESLSMYAFNLYLERGTISPEPQILIRLQPGATSSWTQRLTFDDLESESDDDISSSIPGPGLQSIALTSSWSTKNIRGIFPVILVALLAVSTVIFSLQSSWNRRRNEYSQIPDSSITIDDDPETNS